MAAKKRSWLVGFLIRVALPFVIVTWGLCSFLPQMIVSPHWPFKGWPLTAKTIAEGDGLQTKLGTYGDMFGALNCLFSGLALAGVAYAVHLQRKELDNQEKEIERADRASMLQTKLAAYQSLADHHRQRALALGGKSVYAEGMEWGRESAYAELMRMTLEELGAGGGHPSGRLRFEPFKDDLIEFHSCLMHELRKMRGEKEFDMQKLHTIMSLLAILVGSFEVLLMGAPEKEVAAEAIDGILGLTAEGTKDAIMDIELKMHIIGEYQEYDPLAGECIAALMDASRLAREVRRSYRQYPVARSG